MISTKKIILAAIVILIVPITAFAHKGKARLGVVVEDDDGQVVVEEVVEGSAADRAGIEAGDVIVDLDGKRLEEPSDLGYEIRQRDSGEPISIRISRDGREQVLRVVLEERHERWQHRVEKRRPIHVRIGSGHARLGVRLQELSDGLRDHFGVDDDLGVLVSEVIDDSAAERAGVEAGDVITTIDGEDVEDAGDVRNALEDLVPGDRFELEVVRDRVERSLWVELDEDDCIGRSHHDFDIQIEGLTDEQREEVERAMHEAREEITRALDDVGLEVSRELADAMEEVGRALREEVGPALREVIENLPDVEIEVHEDDD